MVQYACIHHIPFQENYTQLTEKSESLVKRYTECSEIVNDTTEMCDFLHKKLSPVLPVLCNKHNVTYSEYQIQPKCPPLIGIIVI